MPDAFRKAAILLGAIVFNILLLLGTVNDWSLERIVAGAFYSSITATCVAWLFAVVVKKVIVGDNNDRTPEENQETADEKP